MRVDTINFLLTVLIVPSHAFFNKVRSKTSCEPLPHPRHGQVDCTSRDGDGNFNIGAKCTFSCNPGYELEGTLKTSCNRKGQWTSRQIPECVEEGNELIPATPPQDVRLDAAAESLAQFHQPKQASPIDHGLNISSDVMVKFLEFILENPQTNSAHAFSAFQRGDLTPKASEEEPSVSQQYDFEEMESPEVLYDDEYESDFYKSFDDQMFQSSDWSTSWEDPSMDWLQQAHIDHIDNKLEVTTFSTTTLSDLINPTTSSTTTSTTTTRLEVSQPVAQLEEVANDKIAVSWSKSDVQGSRAVLPVNYRVSLYDRSTRRLIRTETTSDTFVKMEELDSETEYAVQVTAIVDGEEEADTLESNEAEVVVKTSPKPPTVTASNIGPTAIRIHWSRITSALSYVVTVLDDQGDQVFSDFKFPSFDSMDVRNLYPNAQYDIIVHAILLDDRQVSTRITHRTSSPSELHIDLDTVTNSQISLSWSKSLGVTSYEVTLTLADVGAAVLNKKLDHETNSFDFHALLPFTAYEITVKAFYSHGIFVTATETTRTASIAPEVSADSVGTESSLVSWSRVPGAGNFTLNLYQNNVLMQSHQLDSAEENFRLENLLPYTSYEAELLAHLSGESDLAGYVDFKTDPKSPEIEIQQVTESSVEFSWNPVPDALSYNIMLASNDKQPVELEVGPATSTLSLDNLDHWSQYTITVSAHQAARRFTSSQTFQTKSIAPVISNTETTSTSASFSWSGVPGVSSGYFVKFGAEEEIFVREKHFTMSDLTPYTSYNVVVTGRTPDGESYSTQQTIVTDPEPATLSLISVSSSGFVIEWTKVPESTVYLTTIRDQEGALVDQRRAHSLERFEFNNLSPFRQYKVQVAAQYAGKSLASEIDILTDPEPAVINVKHLGATYLSIWWPSVPGTKSYTVQLTDNQSNDVISEANLSNEDILVWEQGNLLPSKEYTVRVVSIQHAKQLENSISVRTLDVPAMPSLQIQDVRSTSVQLLWKRPTEWDQNEPHIVTPMFLELEYNINDSTENSQITVIEKKFSEHFVLNLEPGQHYVFALRAIYEFGASEPTRAGIVTAPLLSKTEVVSVSSTTAELSWEPVTGATSYFVWIEPEVKGQKSPLKLLTNELLLSGLDMETSYNISLVGELTDATTDKLSGISFVTSPPPPVLIIDEIKSTSMKLSSSFIADAVQYDIVYFPTQEPEYDALVTLHGHNIQRDVEQLEADTFYTFKLRAIMNDNTHTDWTEAVYTTAPEGAALWFDHIRSSSLELHWQPVQGALLYSIEIKPNVEGFPMIVEKSQQMITVDNLSPDTEYEFMLVTSVDFGRTDPSYATQKTVVASPLVTIDTVRSSEFEVSWENDESCNEYKVSMVPPSGQIFHDRNVVKVTDVLPDSDFTLDVVCSVDFGESDTAKVQVTSVIAPPQPVLESVRSTSAVLKWSNNEAIYSRFEVKLVSSESNELSILSGDNLVLDELSPNSDYIIQFDAYTINGEHCDTLQISLRTAPSPPEVILDSIRSSTADLLWNGALDFEHFEVTFEPSVGFLPDKIYGSSLSLENLQPGTTFNCKIVGVTESSRSDEFETSFTTAPASPLASIDTVRTSEMTISWDSVEGSTHAELTFFPEVDYANSEGRIKVLSHDYIAKQLSPSTDYQVSLSLVMNGNTKTDPVIMHRRTAPPAPIVVASDITSSQVQLAWSTIEDISHYVLDVFPKTEQVPDKLRTISKQLLTNSLLLKELRHDTLYQVQIKAVMFDESETEVGHLQVLTAPKKPTLMMSSVRTTSARVFWTKTSPRVTGYRVRVEPPINGQTNFDRNNTVLSLEGTEASVSYTVTVVALVEQGETDLSSLTLLTAPPPIEARSKQKRSTSIIIEWEPVPNAYRYVAMISPPTQTGLTKIPISKNFLQLVDLAPETDYRMVLTALAPRGAWTTDEHTCDFATGPELGAVLIQNVTSQAMFLSWPALDAVDYYTMTLTPPLPSQPNPIKVLDPTGVKLENMVPSTKYAIELCGFSTDPEADFHTDAVTYTHFTAPPAPILSFPIKKSRRLGLQWTQLPENFIYELDMRPIPVGYENSLPMKLTENEILVTGMEPETLYYFMIKARSSDNVLTTDEFVISQATAPLGPPIVVEPHNIRTTSALIEWEEIPNAVLYRLRAFSKSSDDYDVMYVTSDIHHVLQGLTKLTTYIVHVSATLEDGGETDISEIEFETAPEPPKIRVYRARVKRDATVSVNCSMNEIPDKASYSVNLSPPIGSMSEERTTTDFYLPAWGLKLGSPYMLGIFATMKDGKRTDVRSVQFKTPATPRCYSCNSVGSPDKCKEEVPCPLMGGYACMTFDRRENGRRMLTRGCKKRDACNVQRNSHKCYGRHGRLNQCILVGCCSDDLCNEGNNLNGPFDPHLRWLPDRRPWE